jgi:hypothetical protein
MPPDRFDDLVGRVIDAEPCEADIADLVELARDDPARRDAIARQLEADEMMALAEDDLRDSARFAAALQARIFEDPFVDRVRRGLKRRRVVRAVLPWAAAALVLLALALWRVPWQTTMVEASVAELVDAQGAIQWTGDGGRVDIAPAAGRRLSGGTIESLAPDAWATLRFPDTTEVTISGNSSLTISGAPDSRRTDRIDRAPQKHWYLKRGRLSAEVAPQPPGQPLLVSTPAATLEVAGKVRVATDAAATTVSVGAGAARVERPLDGAVMDVPAAHRGVAPAAADEALRVVATGAPVSSWTANLEAEANQGEWVDDLVALRRRLTVAIRAGELTPQAARRQFADRASHGALDAGIAGSLHAVLSPGGSGLYVAGLTLPPDRLAPVVLAGGSRLRVRGRVQTPADLVIGMGVGQPGGAPTARAVAAPVTVQGEFDVVVPVSALRTRGANAAPPIGMELFTWFGWTRSPDAALEITSVELTAP